MKEGDQGTRRAGEAKEKEKRTKDQVPKINVVLKGKTQRRKLCQETGLPLHPTRLSIIPARYPIRVANQIDKGIAVPQIVHSPIHVASQFVPSQG
jgi:hypothetical protein